MICTMRMQAASLLVIAMHAQCIRCTMIAMIAIIAVFDHRPQMNATKK